MRPIAPGQLHQHRCGFPPRTDMKLRRGTKAKKNRVRKVGRGGGKKAVGGRTMYYVLRDSKLFVNKFHSEWKFYLCTGRERIID